MVFVFENTKQIPLELIPGSWRHLSTPRATCAFDFEPLHEATAPVEGLIHSQAGFPRQEARAGQSRGQSQASHPHSYPTQVPDLGRDSLVLPSQEEEFLKWKPLQTLSPVGRSQSSPLSQQDRAMKCKQSHGLMRRVNHLAKRSTSLPLTLHSETWFLEVRGAADLPPPSSSCLHPSPEDLWLSHARVAFHQLF